MSALHLLLIPATLIAIWLLGDLVYALYVRFYMRISTRPHTPAIPFTLNPEGSPTALFIHGFADNPSVFRHMAPALAASGLAVRAMHLPGFGPPADNTVRTSLQTWRTACDTELQALVDHVQRPVWLIGHSLGGTLALDTALRNPEQVAGIILLAPLLEPSRSRSPVLTPRQWYYILRHTTIFTRILISRLPVDIHNPSAKKSYYTDHFVRRDAYDALFDAIHAIRRRAADWKKPLWMAVSMSDRVVDSATSIAYFSAATHAKPTRLVKIHSSGHVLPLDDGHEKLEQQIIQFIRG